MGCVCRLMYRGGEYLTVDKRAPQGGFSFDWRGFTTCFGDKGFDYSAPRGVNISIITATEIRRVDCFGENYKVFVT